MQNKDVINIADFIEMQYLKSDLIFEPDEEIFSYYDDTDNYIELIDTIKNLYNFDEGNFILTDYLILNRLYKLVNLKRFDKEITNLKTDIIDDINGIIRNLNRLKNMSPVEKKKRYNGYVKQQEKLRGIEFDGHDDLMYSLGYDGMTLELLAGRELDDEDIPIYVLQSLNYMIEKVPFLFSNKEVVERTVEIIDVLSTKTNDKKEKKFSKEIKKIVLTLN